MFPLDRISLGSVIDYVADRIADRVAARLAEQLLDIRGQLWGIKNTIKTESKIMATELSDLTDEVAATKAGEESAIVALAGIEARLEAAIASGNPAALVALKDSLASERAALAAAIVAIPPAPPVSTP